MKIIVSDDVAKWYQQELDIREATYIRFHVRYGGMGGNIPGFSLGINMDDPVQIHASTKVNNITFYIEESDAWYFENKDLVIKLDKKNNEPQFTYQ